MGKKAQALLELTIFLGIMLTVLLTALNYQRNLREQKLTDTDVFAQVKDRAYRNKFLETDLDGETWECSGGIVSYSLSADRQANRIFQGGQRRTAASSASVYYSNAENPQSLEFNYFNTINISDGEVGKKIYYVRPASDLGREEDPEDGLKLSTADYFCAAYPLLSKILAPLFNLALENFVWYVNWGSFLDYAIRFASFIYFVNRYNEAISNVAGAERARTNLEALDTQMGEWGWRVCDKVHDGDKAGKWYVKEVTKQVWDVEIEEKKSIDYNEALQTNSSTRGVGVEHKVKRIVYRRYDITAPDPTIALSGHTFDGKESKEVLVDLGGGQSETWSW